MYNHIENLSPYNYPNPYQYNPDNIRNLELRIIKLERDVRRLEGQLNSIKVNNNDPYEPNHNYQPNSYNMF